MTTKTNKGSAAQFPDLSSLKVVVVDDLAFSRTVTRSLLIAAGVKSVEVAADVIEGWRAVCSLRPDLLILDWQLEGAPGLDLLRLIRHSADSKNPFLAVLMLTAFREERRVREAIALGITSYLTKPFTPRDFLLKVKFCVEDQRGFMRGPGYFGPALKPPPADDVVEV